MHTDGCRLCVHTVHVPDIPVPAIVHNTTMAKRKTLYGNNREIVTIAIVLCFCISLVLDYSECLTIGRCLNLL